MDGARPTPLVARLAARFPALRHRNLRLFVAGQFVSLLGTWMQTLAVGWLVYSLTRSPLLLGVAGFLAHIPSLFLAPLAGVWIDRWNRHRILIGTQALAMVQAIALAALAWTGTATIELVLALGFFLGVVNAVEVPARQSFLVETLEDRKDLSSAIALNSASFNGARLLGPSLAGFVLAAGGERAVFLLNAVSYVPVLAALLAIQVRSPSRPTGHDGPAAAYLAKGVAYVTAATPIRNVLLFVAFVSVVAAPYTVLMPVFARDVLHGGPRTLGLLVGAIGAGALGGSLYVASGRGAGRHSIPVFAAVLGAALVALCFARHDAVAVAVLLAAGFGNTALLASSNTAIQTLVDDDKRGRVMSFYTVALVGMMPLGSLAVGAVTHLLGAPATVFGCGAACLAGAATFSRATRRTAMPRACHD